MFFEVFTDFSNNVIFEFLIIVRFGFHFMKSLSFLETHCSVKLLIYIVILLKFLQIWAKIGSNKRVFAAPPQSLSLLWVYVGQRTKCDWLMYRVFGGVSRFK